MSSGIPFTTIRKTMLGMIALVSMAVYGANPHPPAEKERAKAPTASLPSSKPKPPAVRNAASFTLQTPFSEAIDILRNSTTPPLKIIVLWKPLGDSAGVYRDTPIGIDGVAGLRVGQVLDLLMLSLSAGASAKIGYIVDKGVITISTTNALPTPKPVARVYDISDLVAPPARYSLQSMGFGMGYGGPMTPFGNYPGNLGTGSPNPASSPSRNTGQIARTYRNR
jgi:hypothetical protein